MSNKGVWPSYIYIYIYIYALTKVQTPDTSVVRVFNTNSGCFFVVTNLQIIIFLPHTHITRFPTTGNCPPLQTKQTMEDNRYKFRHIHLIFFAFLLLGLVVVDLLLVFFFFSWSCFAFARL